MVQETQGTDFKMIILTALLMVSLFFNSWLLFKNYKYRERITALISEKRKLALLSAGASIATYFIWKNRNAA